MVHVIAILASFAFSVSSYASDKDRRDFYEMLSEMMRSADPTEQRLADMFYIDSNQTELDGGPLSPFSELSPALGNNLPPKYESKWRDLQAAWNKAGKPAANNNVLPEVKSSNQGLDLAYQESGANRVEALIPAPASKHTRHKPVAQNEDVRRAAQRASYEFNSGVVPSLLGKSAGEISEANRRTQPLEASRSNDPVEAGRVATEAHNKKAYEQCVGDLCDLYKYIHDSDPSVYPFAANPKARKFIKDVGDGILQCGGAACMNDMIDRFVQLHHPQTGPKTIKEKAADYAEAEKLRQEIIKEALAKKERVLNGEDPEVYQESSEPGFLVEWVVGQRDVKQHLP